MSNITVRSPDTLSFNGKVYHCALGRGGVREDKKEGDGATPVGCFPIRMVYYRPDRFEYPPKTVFPTRALQECDGWGDDEKLPEYNNLIELPYKGSHEVLWRDDHTYDILVVLGYNDDPPVPGKGSAIFMHLAREGYSPTDGCIALNMKDLLEILCTADRSTRVCVRS